jgi:hypothetical protein
MLFTRARVNISSATGVEPSAAQSLVAGHYQPLADNLGIAPKSDQTGSLQSVQRTLQSP